MKRYVNLRIQMISSIYLTLRKSFSRFWFWELSADKYFLPKFSSDTFSFIVDEIWGRRLVALHNSAIKILPPRVADLCEDKRVFAIFVFLWRCIILSRNHLQRVKNINIYAKKIRRDFYNFPLSSFCAANCARLSVGPLPSITRHSGVLPGNFPRTWPTSSQTRFPNSPCRIIPW